MAVADLQSIHSVLVAALRPIAAMLLRFGVGYRDFTEASKIAFVEMAAKECEGSAGRINASRIALMTGLSRKDVRTIIEGQENGRTLDSVNIHIPAEVLRIWFTNPLFCSRDGYPKSLAWDSGRDSFIELVRRCNQSLSPIAIRAELLRVGAISQNSAGELQALRRHFVAEAARERLIEGIQFGLRPLALTLAKNTAIDGCKNLRFQRVVDSYAVSIEQRQRVERAIYERLQEFSEEIDDILSEASSGTNSHEFGSAIGVGLFYYDED